jgi:hypothetical protein
MLFFYFACAVNTTELSQSEILTRVSLDMRGYRPSLEELDRFNSDFRLEKGIKEILESDNFGQRYAQLMSGFWRTQVVELDHTDHPYSIPNAIETITALGEEPLYVLAEIANNDLPYSEFVTADWTINNHILAEWSPVTYPQGETGWKKVTYTDNRPKAGVLVSNGLWWRYTSTQNNANRGRANIVSKNLLCNDYLRREITVDRDLNLLDEDAVLDALRNSPSCFSCHSSLDPLAANFWGFYRHFRFSPEEQFSYHPERERDWVTYTGVAPGYFGKQTNSLEELANEIINDPRYYECITKRTMEQLYHRPLDLDDLELKNNHLEVFEKNNYSLRALAKSIVLDDNYRSKQQNKKIVTPNLFASQIEHLTLYRFQADSLDAIDSDLFGLRSMAGGVGEDYSQERFVSPSPTFTLVIERIAQAAAYHVTHNEQAANLFFHFDFQHPQSNSNENFQYLFRKVISRPPSSEELEVLNDLWDDIYLIENSTTDAWEITVGLLFRHPDFLTY